LSMWMMLWSLYFRCVLTFLFWLYSVHGKSAKLGSRRREIFNTKGPQIHCWLEKDADYFARNVYFVLQQVDTFLI
jgi:hypothetical protein